MKDVAKGLFQSQHLTHTKDLYDPPGKGPEASWVQPGCLSRPRKSHISPTWRCRTPRSLSDGEVTLPGDVIDKECPSCTSVVASRHRPEGMTGASNNEALHFSPQKPYFLLNHNIEPGRAGRSLQSRESSVEQLFRSGGSWVCMWLSVGSRHQESLTSLSSPPSLCRSLPLSQEKPQTETA